MKKNIEIQIPDVHNITSSTSKDKKHSPQKTETLTHNSLSPFYNTNNTYNYKYLLNKLLKFLKKTLQQSQYEQVKLFIKTELHFQSSSQLIKSESLSSLLVNNNYDNNQKYQNTKNSKKLKMSYDFSNLLTSPRQKPIKIDITRVKNNTTLIPNKEVHSLYSIVKTNSQKNEQKTQSNSKSKSTSRECSNPNTNNTIQNNISTTKGQKVKTVKQTLITKSQPLLNKKLFSKISFNNKINNNKVSKLNNMNNMNNTIIKKENSASRQKQKSFSKTKMGINKNNHNHIPSVVSKGKKAQNKTVNALPPKSYWNGNGDKKNKVIKGKSQFINLNNNINSTNVIKNEELMKQIKNTLDDNLKVIFNFSYENFLSKESESESKNSQQEILIKENKE